MSKCVLLVFILNGFLFNIQGYSDQQENSLFHQLRRSLIRERRQGCQSADMCKSKWGFCGYGDDYCGAGCQSGPCKGSTGKNIINENNFQCAFSNLDGGARAQRLNGLKQSGWQAKNTDEAAVFLAHVYHETDGLKTLTEYCAPGCGPNYAQSWCEIKAAPGKFYYGRGWFQLSYPCNYNAAGKSLGLDLLNNPDLVNQDQSVAVRTAVWFYQTNNMAGPAQRGDFAATTRIINGKQECDGGPGAGNQKTRVATYKRIRHCFGLGEPKINPMC